MLKIWQRIIKFTSFFSMLFLLPLPVLSQDGSYPESGTIVNLSMGDIMCYVSIMDDNGNTVDVGARFEFCEEPEMYMNRIVNLSYVLENVNDCESNEPCGETRVERIIDSIDIVD